jgi:antitoxin component of RelBE/YafQ-DinJ toxin-antitoxin module
VSITEENLEIIEIEVDAELLRQVEELIQPMGINMEQLIQMFFSWVVDPNTREEAITQLLKWKEQV